MAKRFLTVSDLTGNPVDDEQQVVTIAVLEHPALEHPVQLDASVGEIKSLDKKAKDFVLLEVISDGGDKSERVVLELADFEALIKSGDPQEVLDNAERYNAGGSAPAQQEQPRRRGRPAGSGSAAPKADRVDYKTPENFGLIHRGRITEEEKAMVQGDFDGANKNRKREGQPEIDLRSEKDVTKYDLHKLAEKAGIVPK